jgi:putative DNA primase/helicase
MSVGPLYGAVEVIADSNPVNRVADWITGRPWDGVDRISAICATLTTKTGFPEHLKKTLIHKWLRSAVAALFVLGFSSRSVLTLQGPQGLGKTRWLMSLVSDEFLRAEVVRTGHHLDPRSKDDVLGAVTHWIVELGELDSTLKKDVAALKAFLSNDSDKVRRPYGRLECEYPRRTVFCATVNELNYLVDRTGNARFWTLPVVKIDYEHRIDMQQLFAQLLVELQQGQSWRLTDDEQTALDKVNLDHRDASTIRDLLEENIDLARKSEAKLPARTATQVLREVGIKNPTNPQCKEAASILREMLGEEKRIHGAMKWRVPLRLLGVNGRPEDEDEY